MIHYYDPNNRYGEHTIKVTIQRCDYRGHIWVKIRGNVKGFAVMSDITDVIFEKAIWKAADIDSDCGFVVDEEGWYKAVLKNNEGDTLKDEGDEREFEDAIVGVEVVDFIPMKTEVITAPYSEEALAER